MRKTTALTLGLFILLSFLFFVSPVGKYVSGITSLLRPPETNAPDTSGGNTLAFSLPDGFTAYVYAGNVGGARVLARDPRAGLIASLTSEGEVVALLDRDGNGKAEEPVVLLNNLNNPHGLALRCTEQCELYVAEEDGVTVYRYEYDDSAKLSYPIDGKKIIDLPAGSGHYTRSLLFMPSPDDHRLLTSVGSSCNVCEESDARRAKILVSNADGSDLQEFASGLRHTVFMTIHPVTDAIWGTEMGRDNLGDDLPPDEINIVEEGKNYGWPICYGKNVHDTNFDKNTYIRNPCMESFETPSHIDIPAHSAPLGLAFVPEEGWPEEFWYDALVAYHGSWNRSTPTGYKIVRFPLDAEGNLEGSPEDFMTGFIDENGNVIGRPVDILIEPGGVMYVSDDRAGMVYRIARTPPK